jgi:predicted RNA-binding Zn ribbon-like protein
MTGETPIALTGGGTIHAAASIQPGGRAPAPGELALVQSFLNSHYSLGDDHGADLWPSPASLEAWLRGRELISSNARIGRPELERALQVREGLRWLAAGDKGSIPIDHGRRLHDLNTACVGAPVELRFGADAPHFVRGRAGTFADALGLILGISAGSMIDGRWARLKVCPGIECGWAFYDASRNRTGRWCSMSVCGGRAKARTHYHRHRQAAP